MSTPTPDRAYEIFIETRNSMLENYPAIPNTLIINSYLNGHKDYLSEGGGYIDIRGEFELTNNATLKQGELTTIQVTLTPESGLYIYAEISTDDGEGWSSDDGAQEFLQTILEDAADVMRTAYQKCHDEHVKIFVSSNPIQGLGKSESLLDAEWLANFKSDLAPLTASWHMQNGTRFVNLQEPCGLLSVAIGGGTSHEFHGKGEAYVKQFITLPEENAVWFERLCEAAHQFSKTEEGVVMINEGKFDWSNVLHAIQSDYPHLYANLSMMPAEKALEQAGGNIKVCMMGEVRVSLDDDLLAQIARAVLSDYEVVNHLNELDQDNIHLKAEVQRARQDERIAMSLLHDVRKAAGHEGDFPSLVETISGLSQENEQLVKSLSHLREQVESLKAGIRSAWTIDEMVDMLDSIPGDLQSDDPLASNDGFDTQSISPS